MVKGPSSASVSLLIGPTHTRSGHFWDMLVITQTSVKVLVLATSVSMLSHNIFSSFGATWAQMLAVSVAIIDESSTTSVGIRCCWQPFVITWLYNSIWGNKRGENLNRGRHSLTLCGCCRRARLLLDRVRYQWCIATSWINTLGLVVKRGRRGLTCTLDCLCKLVRCRQSRTATDINRQINELGVQSGDVCLGGPRHDVTPGWHVVCALVPFSLASDKWRPIN